MSAGGTPETPKGQEGDSGGALPPALCLPVPRRPTSHPTHVVVAALPWLRAAWLLCDILPDAEVVAPSQHQSRQQSSTVARGPGQGDNAKEVLYTKVSGSSPGQAQHPCASLWVPMSSTTYHYSLHRIFICIIPKTPKISNVTLG